jgi:hypothetical protein
MSRAHDPLLDPSLKKAALGSDLHWTDIALLTTIAKGNEALREAELNIPRNMADCSNALGNFASASSHEAEKQHLDRALRDANQMMRAASRVQRRIIAMKRKIVTNRYPE